MSIVCYYVYVCAVPFQLNLPTNALCVGTCIGKNEYIVTVVTMDNSFYRTVLAEPLAKQYDVPLYYRMDGWTYLSIFKISTPLLMS